MPVLPKAKGSGDSGPREGLAMPVAQEEPPFTELLGLAIAEPRRAEAWADRIIAHESDPIALSVGHQARAIVLRDRGRLDLALPELRLAVRLAARSGDLDREADVRATLGVALAMAGRTEAGLDQLRRAVESATDPTASAKILMRRGHVRYFVLLQPREALADLERALPRLRAADEKVWEARTLNLIGLSRLALGDAERAAAALEPAERIFVMEGQHAEAAVTLHNRGRIAYCRGDLPTALRLYDEAAERYAALGEDSARAVNDQCEALLTAGLAREAASLAVRRVEAGSLPADVLAELLLKESMAELADNQPTAAVASATRARRLFRSQRRAWWELAAELAVLRARSESGIGGRRLAEAAARVADGLADGRADEAAAAWLLAGRTAASSHLSSAGDLLERAARYRLRSSGLVKAAGWQARALGCELRDDSRGVLTACRRGLDALDEHRATLGSSELRALATRHGDELATLALRHAARRGPRRLLEWSERWRANALFQPPVHPPDDDELARDLAALRDTRRRLGQARAEGSPLAAKLDDDRARLEQAIRRRTHHLAGESAAVERFTTERLLVALDGASFVELVDLDATLHALVVANGRVRRFAVGAVDDAGQAVAFARFALRQAARGRPSDLEGVGHRLQSALLGDAAGALGDGPVVVSPTSRLHATPWALLPSLVDLPVSVAPSAALWLKARSAPHPPGHRVLVAGPRLESGGAEIDVLARRHPEAVLLRDSGATVERALEALDGAAIAHVAAHGRFREDSPMFSSLDLDDGPLTVHDFERLHRAPYRMVLSACESGVVAPIGAGEMLGLVSAMLAMGSAGIVSSVAKVNDRATAELMLVVHAAMDEGEDLGHVLLRAREAARGDRVREATAAAFLAMGV
jgi:tetratricopeptide (TPR) repeat protein